MIVAKIRKCGLNGLDEMARDHASKFDMMLTAPVDDIMSTIPDEFSSCEFFQKIELITCFRPDCTIKLLTDWFNVNLGSTISTQFSKLLEHSAADRPIMVYEKHDSRVSSTIYIEHLY
jgi:hypothetical protein